MAVPEGAEEIDIVAAYWEDVRAYLKKLVDLTGVADVDFMGFIPMGELEAYDITGQAPPFDETDLAEITKYQEAAKLGQIVKSLKNSADTLYKANPVGSTEDWWDDCKKIKSCEELEEYAVENNMAPDNEAFYREIVAQSVASFLQDVRDAIQNQFASEISEDTLNIYFYPRPPIDADDQPSLSSILEGLLDTSLTFLVGATGKGIGFPMGADIRSVAYSDALGPATITDDSILESSLQKPFYSDYYIGMLLDPRKSKKRSSPYLPIRTSPALYDPPLKLGWDDFGYKILDNDGDMVDRESTSGNYDDNGIEIPLGTSVEITEITYGNTGPWVGFVFHPSEEDNLDLDWDLLDTDGRPRVLYTRPFYIKKRSSAINVSPDPILAPRLSNTDSSSNRVAISPGNTIISPGKTYNWTKIPPGEARLAYFNFNQFNEDEIGEDLEYTAETINFKSTLRYSEGYYYFIVGEGRRTEPEAFVDPENMYQEKKVTVTEYEHGQAWESEITVQACYDTSGKEIPCPEDIDIDFEELGYDEDSEDALDAIAQIQANTVNEGIKSDAFGALLKYLNKDKAETFLLNQLREKYFVPVSTRVSTQGVSPNNQQSLFAISAMYIDALPDSKKIYSDNFEDDSEFKNGRNFIFNVPLGGKNSLKNKANNLKKVFEEIKNRLKKFEDQKGVIKNPYDLKYDVDSQIQEFDKIVGHFTDFFAKQAYPSTTDRDAITLMLLEAFEDENNDHLIQVGLRDNGLLGENARLTISHILFSPDPKSLKSLEENKNSKLFEFDPYLTDQEIARGATTMPRSAVTLRVGLDSLREKFLGVQGSRTLHYLMFESNMFVSKQKLGDQFDVQQWIKFLQSFSVPPFKIWYSKDRSERDVESLSCLEIIEKLSNSSTEVGPEERKLEELLYSNPECMEKWKDMWSAPTPATDPEASRKAIEKRAKDMETASDGSNVHWERFKIFYNGFLHTLDPQGLMSLLLTCLQAKLGIPMTAEAICEAAIAEIIEADPGGFKTLIIENVPELAAQLGWASEGYLSDETAAVLEELEQSNSSTGGATNTAINSDGDISPKFAGAPIAASLALVSSGDDTDAINIILNLEKGGHYIDLEPGYRPETAQAIEVLPFGIEVEADQGSKYTWSEIENERERLLQLGYSSSEARALLVQKGYLIPTPAQYEPLLGGDMALESLEAMASDLSAIGAPAKIYGADIDSGSMAGTIQDAKNWVTYIKKFMDLGALCELIVGPLLDLPGLLFSDPDSWAGGFESWGGDYWDRLKKRFSFPVPTISFPDKLETDDFIGDYGQKLLETVLSMLGYLLGQSLSLVLREYIENCIEEGMDQGIAGNAATDNNALAAAVDSGSISLPRLQNILKPLSGQNDPEIVFGWITDLMSEMSLGQLCALLKGEASEALLLQCVRKTRTSWPDIFKAGYDTTAEHNTIFKTIGESMSLDLCNRHQPVDEIITSPCAVDFNSDARLQELKKQGLTSDEAADQLRSELGDLRNKIIGLADFIFHDPDPFKNKLPAICGPGGFFALPEGIKNTMERVTNNILTSVKGSLMVDLRAVKFFSMPPRAVEAATSAEKLEEAHKVFAEALANPYTSSCVAYVGPTGNDVGDPSTADHMNYKMTYNERTSYGMFLPVGAETGHESYTDDSFYDPNGDGEINKTIVELSSDTVKLYQEYLQQIEPNPEDIRDHTQPVPLTIAGVVLEGEHENRDYTVGGTENNFWLGRLSGTDVDGSVLSSFIEQAYADNPEYVELLPPGTVISYSPEFHKRVRDLIIGSFTEDIQPNGLATLLWTDRALYSAASSVHMAGTFHYSSLNSPAGIPHLAYYGLPLGPKTSHSKHPGTAAGDSNSWGHPMQCLITWPLDTPLRGISPLRSNWWDMFGMFIGASPLLATSMNNSSVAEYEQYVKDINAIDRIDQRLAYIVPSAIKASSATITDTLGNLPSMSLIHGHTSGDQSWKLNPSSTGALEKEQEKGPVYIHRRLSDWAEDMDTALYRQYDNPQQFNHPSPLSTSTGPYWTKLTIPWYVVLTEESPGVNYLYNKFIKDGDLEYKAWNLIDAFMELTLGEAAGLTKERMSMLYPNMPGGPNMFNGLILGYGCPTYHIIKTTNQIFTHGDDTVVAKDKDGNPIAGSTQDYTDPTTGLDVEGEPKPTTALWYDSKQILWYETSIVGTAKTINPLRQSYKSGAPSFFPIGLTYDRHLRDPNSLLNQDEETVINHFMGANALVNKEYYSTMINQYQPYIYEDFTLGTGLAAPPLQYSSLRATSPPAPEARTMKNFNPNYLSYNLPLTDISYKNINSANITSQLMKVFSGIQTDNAETALLLDQLQFSTTPKKLVHQNVRMEAAGSTLDNITSQAEAARDNFSVFKSQVLMEDDPAAGEVILEDNKLNNTNYNYEFGQEYAPDIKDLLDELFALDGWTTANHNSIATQYNKNISAAAASSKSYDMSGGTILNLGLGLDPETDAPFDIEKAATFFGAWTPNNTSKYNLTRTLDWDGEAGDHSAVEVNPLNNKPTIFCQLLEKKFNDALIHHGGTPMSEEQRTHLKAVLTYGYTALQHAYSGQAFNAIRHSRLNYRKYLRKLWKKILKSPLNKSNVDPRCAALFDQLGMTATADLQNTETDFFNLEKVKSSILEFYEKSICRDIFEGSLVAEGAVQRSLLEGCTILLIRVFTLEICLAGIAAWDGFNLYNVFEDDLTIVSVIDNLKKETPNFDLIVEYSNDILKKKEGYSNIEAFLALEDTSALKYLISEEGKNIAEIIDTLFENSDRVNTNISVEVDRETIDDLTRVRSRILNNVYTMNYGGNTKLHSEFRGPEFGLTEVNPALAGEVLLGALYETALPGYSRTEFFGHDIGLGVDGEAALKVAQDEHPTYYVATQDWQPASLAATKSNLYDYGSGQKDTFHSLPINTMIYNPRASAGDIGQVASQKVYNYKLKKASGGYVEEGDILDLGKSPYILYPQKNDASFRPNNYNYIFSQIESQTGYSVVDLDASTGKPIGLGKLFVPAKPDLSPSLFKSLGPDGALDEGYFFDDGDNYGLAAFENIVLYGESEAGTWSGFVGQKIKARRILDPALSEASDGSVNYLARPESIYTGNSAPHLDQKPSVAGPRTRDLWKDSENLQEYLVGNNINFRFGNMTFQPFVRVVDTTAAERQVYRITTEVEYPIGEDPCFVPIEPGLPGLTGDAFEGPLLGNYRSEANVFQCHMFDYIPLGVWEYFCKYIMLPYLAPTGAAPDLLKSLYNSYGLAPFFSKIEFGLRLTYNASYPVMKEWYHQPFAAQMIQGYVTEGSSGGHDFNDLMQDPARVLAAKRTKSLFQKRKYLDHFDYDPTETDIVQLANDGIDFIRQDPHGPSHFYQPNIPLSFEETSAPFSSINANDAVLDVITPYEIERAQGVNDIYPAMAVFYDRARYFPPTPNPTPTEIASNAELPEGTYDEDINAGYLDHNEVWDSGTPPEEFTWGEQALLTIFGPLLDAWSSGAAVTGKQDPEAITAPQGEQAPVELEEEAIFVNPTRTNIAETYLVPEIHIPIIEVSRELDLKKGNFVLEGTHYNYASLSESTSLFHDIMAYNFFEEMKDTAEFKLLFGHLLPVKRYFSLALLYSAEGMSRWIPETSDLLDETKDMILSVVQGLRSSSDYNYVPDPIKNLLEEQQHSAETGTTGQEPGLTKQILKLILETPLLILKGFVEITDPAIIIAKAIIDIANTVQQTIIGAIEQSLRMAKAAVDQAVKEAQNGLTALDGAAGQLRIPLEFAKSSLPQDLQGRVHLVTDGALMGWEVGIYEPTPADSDYEAWENWKSENTSKYNDIVQAVEDINGLKEDYETVQEDIVELQQKSDDIKEEIDLKMAEAKEIMKAIFSSPYLLPSLWAAMLPSQLPYFGGLIPAPIVIGPPSTVPGMIYLALLLMDVYEDKMHDDIENIGNDPNCQDEL